MKFDIVSDAAFYKKAGFPLLDTNKPEPFLFFGFDFRKSGPRLREIESCVFPNIAVSRLVFPSTAIANVAAVKSKLTFSLMRRRPDSDKMSLAVILENLFCTWSVLELRCLSFQNRAVAVVISDCTELEVFNVIVQRVFVFVIYARISPRIRQKSESDKAMNQKHLHFPVLAECDLKIAFVALPGL